MSPTTRHLPRMFSGGNGGRRSSMARFSKSIRVGRRGRKAGPGGTMAAGGCFAVLGGLMTLVTAFVALQTIGTYRWDQVEARLDHCEVQVREGGQRLDQPFELVASYRYQVDGRDFIGTKVRTGDSIDSSYEKLALLRARLLAADPLVAYVDPGDPARAVLKRDSLWMVLIVLFPLVFVAIGVGLFRHGLKMRRRIGSADAPGGEPVESLAAAATGAKGSGTWFGLLFCLVFLLAGIGVSFPLVILPWQQSRAAEQWIEAPAEVIWSRVTSHRSDDGTTYGIDIFYRYEVDGVEHRSNRYDFIGGSSSGYQSKKAVVDRYPPGHQFTCYVDPAQPERAVILRDGSIGFWFLLPLAFIAFGAIGAVGFGVGLVKKKLAGSTPGATSPGDRLLGRAAPAITGTSSGAAAGLAGSAVAGGAGSALEAGPAETQFRAGANRRAKLIGTVFVALFWNAIVSVFVVVAIKNPDGDGTPVLLFLFLIPFVLIGLVLIGTVAYTALGMFNPRTNLLLRPGHPRLGRPFVLRWRTFGSLGRLQDLKLTIECVEKASYSRGTNRITDEAAIYRQVLMEARPGLELREGRVDVTLPEDLAPTWEGANNRIEWQIKVTGEIKPGPDVNETHTLTVLPAPPA